MNNRIEFVNKWKQFILLLMSEYVLITKVVYVLYIILLGLFGILLSFLLDIYKQNDDIYLFILLLLLKMLYNNVLDYVFLKSNKIDQFSLKTIEQINSRSSRLILKEPDQISLPFLIIEDPLVFIETEVLWEEPINYKFKLFKFYQNVNGKVKH